MRISKQVQLNTFRSLPNQSPGVKDLYQFISKHNIQVLNEGSDNEDDADDDSNELDG